MQQPSQNVGQQTTSLFDAHFLENDDNDEDDDGDNDDDDDDDTCGWWA